MALQTRSAATPFGQETLLQWIEQTFHCCVPREIVDAEPVLQTQQSQLNDPCCVKLVLRILQIVAPLHDMHPFQLTNRLYAWSQRRSWNGVHIEISGCKDHQQRVQCLESPFVQDLMRLAVCDSIQLDALVDDTMSTPNGDIVLPHRTIFARRHYGPLWRAVCTSFQHVLPRGHPWFARTPSHPCTTAWVLGAPGAGKTTFLWLVLVNALKWLRDDTSRVTSIHLRVNAIGEHLAQDCSHITVVMSYHAPPTRGACFSVFDLGPYLPSGPSCVDIVPTGIATARVRELRASHTAGAPTLATWELPAWSPSERCSHGASRKRSR